MSEEASQPTKYANKILPSIFFDYEGHNPRDTWYQMVSNV